MRIFFKPINNQNGSMILIALMLLVILTLMGITSTSTSVIENRIAVNEQLNRMSFYHADSGLNTTAKIISLTLEENDVIAINEYDFEYAEKGNGDIDFLDYITDPSEYDSGVWDIELILGSGLIRADIEPLGSSTTGDPEGGVMFGEGTTLSQRGLEITLYFRILSVGKETIQPNTEEERVRSASMLSGTFRKVLGGQKGI